MNESEDAGKRGDLDRVDRALVGLRHLWSGPLTLDDPTMGTLDMSTVWIVDALTRDEADDEVTIGELAVAIDVAHSTASRLADRAQASGAVTRRPSSRDARRVVVELTDQGRLLAATARTFRADYLDRTMAAWTSTDRSSFAELLTRFAADVATISPHDPTHDEELT